MYTGRFAPSPSGPLHLGSLLTAVASYLHARRHGGRWLVRIEDVDTGRTQAGAERSILGALQAFGMAWDGEIVYQSRRGEAYTRILDELRQRDLVYPCNCPRKKIAGGVYPGHCRQGMSEAREQFALRVRSETAPVMVAFHDEIQGAVQQNIAAEVGDFILKRSDGLFAYQLAVVVDDAWQGVTHVVRGMDLLDNTPRQIYLQHQLNLATPAYAHVPLLVDLNGYKLSKHNRAPAVDPARPLAQVWQVLDFLGQAPPTELLHGTLARLWEWAQFHWDTRKIPARAEIAAAG